MNMRFLIKGLDYREYSDAKMALEIFNKLGIANAFKEKRRRSSRIFCLRCYEDYLERRGFKTIQEAIDVASREERDVVYVRASNYSEKRRRHKRVFEIGDFIFYKCEEESR